MPVYQYGSRSLGSMSGVGRSFLAAGIAACACGLLLGEADLLRVGVFLCALPLATAIMVARTRYRLSCNRRIEPQRQPVELGLELEHGDGTSDLFARTHRAVYWLLRSRIGISHYASEKSHPRL